MTPSRIHRLRRPAIAGAATIAALGATAAAPAGADRASQQSTQLVSRALDGGLPNGPSSHGVISNDKRYSRAIAFQSMASNIVTGDVNGTSDIFVVRRAGPVDNEGSRWRPGPTRIVSRGLGGVPANGPSYAPAVDGAFRRAPSCVAFLSQASNLVRGDTNGVADAFVASLRTGRVRRISLPGGRQGAAPASAVAVSGDCSRVAWVSAGRLYVRVKGRSKRISAPGAESDPSFSVGLRNDLVFGARRGVYLSRGATRRPRLVARGGRNPAYNDIKRRVVTYEKTRAGRVQIAYRDLGRRERIASDRGGSLGNRASRDPVIGNSGYYIAFESDASNLGTNALRRTGDDNGRTDAYLYTNVRDLTLVQSVEQKGVPLPAGGRNPSMSFYANYILFDSAAPLGAASGPDQVFMRYLGPV